MYNNLHDMSTTSEEKMPSHHFTLKKHFTPRFIQVPKINSFSNGPRKQFFSGQENSSENEQTVPDLRTIKEFDDVTHEETIYPSKYEENKKSEVNMQIPATKQKNDKTPESLYFMQNDNYVINFTTCKSPQMIDRNETKQQQTNFTVSGSEKSVHSEKMTGTSLKRKFHMKRLREKKKQKIFPCSIDRRFLPASTGNESHKEMDSVLNILDLNAFGVKPIKHLKCNSPVLLANRKTLSRVSNNLFFSREITDLLHSLHSAGCKQVLEVHVNFIPDISHEFIIETSEKESSRLPSMEKRENKCLPAADYSGKSDENKYQEIQAEDIHQLAFNSPRLQKHNSDNSHREEVNLFPIISSNPQLCGPNRAQNSEKHTARSLQMSSVIIRTVFFPGTFMSFNSFEAILQCYSQSMESIPWIEQISTTAEPLLLCNDNNHLISTCISNTLANQQDVKAISHTNQFQNDPNQVENHHTDGVNETTHPGNNQWEKVTAHSCQKKNVNLEFDTICGNSMETVDSLMHENESIQKTSFYDVEHSADKDSETEIFVSTGNNIKQDIDDSETVNKGMFLTSKTERISENHLSDNCLVMLGRNQTNAAVQTDITGSIEVHNAIGEDQTNMDITEEEQRGLSTCINDCNAANLNVTCVCTEEVNSKIPVINSTSQVFPGEKTDQKNYLGGKIPLRNNLEGNLKQSTGNRRPFRLGLSRKQKVQRLHPYWRITRED